MEPPHIGHSLLVRSGLVRSDIALSTVASRRFLDKQPTGSYRNETTVSRDRHGFLPHAEWDALSASGSPRDCFADEVAIDFPSVDQFVPRVRDRFFGRQSETETLTTEVSLSRQQATRGTIVPIEVTLRGTCAVCGGRGETWADPCFTCQGTGHSPVHHPVRVPVPAGVVHGTRLRYRVKTPLSAPLRVELRVAVRSSAA